MNDELERLIARYLAGDTSVEENKQLLAFIEATQENKEFFRQIKDNYLLSGALNPDFNKDENWFRLQKNITAPAPRKDHHLLGVKILRWAAVILFAFLSGFFVNYLLQLRADDISSPVCEISAAKGARTFAVLSDSTKVWLNGGSKLTLAEDFNKKSRDVFLNGEAFFDVSKSKDKYFNVYSSNIFIRVLGTQFNVKSYETDDVIETTLKEGKINIYEIGKNENRQIVTLSPNQKVTYVKGTGKISSENLKREYKKTVEKDEEVRYQESNYLIARKVNPADYSSWKDGKLIFRKDRLEDIALSLERHFNVNIRIEDEMAKEVLINANFKNETIEQVLYALSLTSSIDYEISLNQISIRYKPNKMQSK
ncbi:FecR family protein [Maribellus maritimus]|uniref:FecR family protein n=1 Tax=Maribellus maritimus TaxID=2870838 RepID=UPI001EEC4181|nr:FecR family protein [Maribellus maritimus]MCG6186946.1 DUF4974 domain-containing protein [Maribellus maritimus]